MRRYMQALGFTNIDAYLELLKCNPKVCAQCQQRLTVTISRFVRDRRL